MLWSAIQNSALQYTIMIGGTYVLTALIAIFIYTSRLYTNRTVLAGVGKAYIPIEPGEVGRNVRKMIVKQLERSAIIAWESRPRDVLGEILGAEKQGFLPSETESMGRNDYTVGREITVDPAYPPWGEIRHPGWSSPSHSVENVTPSLQFATVIAELPNLIEAQAVSLAPAEEPIVPVNGPPMADPVVADVLSRPETMGMREYLAQLSYLGLVNPLSVGQSFLLQYEKARFGGLPITEHDFQSLMAAFAGLLAGMTELKPEIIEQIREQAGTETSSLETQDIEPSVLRSRGTRSSMYRSMSPDSSVDSPVTARTALSRPSRSVTPYLRRDIESSDSLSSVVRHSPGPQGREDARSMAESESLASDAGSVLRHSPGIENG